MNPAQHVNMPWVVLWAFLLFTFAIAPGVTRGFEKAPDWVLHPIAYIRRRFAR